MPMNRYLHMQFKLWLVAVNYSDSVINHNLKTALMDHHLFARTNF